MRLLIVTHASLMAETGAGQVAINFAEALRLQGHDITLWSPDFSCQVKWWKSSQNMRMQLDNFLSTQKPFDVIDSPAILITSYVRHLSSILVARSVQPDLLYLLYNFNAYAKPSLKGCIRLYCKYAYSLFQSFLIIQGWYKADYILCLGTLEYQWMTRWFSSLKDKLLFYVNTLSATEQLDLEKIRVNRSKNLENNIKFLWIGRWTFHKGTDTLLNLIIQWLAIRSEDTFTIAGCGYEVEKQLFATGFPVDRVNVVPFFTRKDLLHLLSEHDVGLFTSKVEGWGLVLNEMLESGMPVFATRAGAVPDLKPFFDDLLIPFPPTLESIYNSLGKTNSFHEDYYKNFNWNAIAETYIQNILIKNKI